MVGEVAYIREYFEDSDVITNACHIFRRNATAQEGRRLWLERRALQSSFRRKIYARGINIKSGLAASKVSVGLGYPAHGWGREHLYKVNFEIISIKPSRFRIRGDLSARVPVVFFFSAFFFCFDQRII